MLLAHRLVLLETAGGEDDAMARADGDRLAVALRLDAGDAAVLAGQPGQRGIEHHRHIALAQRAAQSADQRIAHGQPAIAMRLFPPGPVEPEFREDLGRGPLPAARAVGQALAKNPFAPTIPCHRVIAANGDLRGYSARGGLAAKARLLKREGAKI